MTNVLFIIVILVAFYILSKLLKSASKPDKVLTHKIVEMTPKEEELNNEAVQLLEAAWKDTSLWKVNHRQAVSILEKSLSINPNCTTTLTNIGCALSNIGNYDQALIYLKLAIDNGSIDKNSYFNMAVTMMNINNESPKAGKFFSESSKLVESTKTVQSYFDPHGY